MAYYKTIQDEEEQRRQTGLNNNPNSVPGAPGFPGSSPSNQAGPINRINADSSTIQPVGPSSGGPTTPVSAAPTRSKSNFVNISRFLEANPLQNTAGKITTLAEGLNSEEDKRFQDSVKSSSDYYKNNSFITPPQFGDFGKDEQGNKEETYWQLITKAANGDKDAEKQLKDLIALNPELYPKDVSWTPDNAIKEKIMAMKNPNRTGTNSLAQQLAGKATNYSSGMEGLDAALFQASPEASAAAKAGLAKYETGNTTRDTGIRDINKKNEDVRQSDKTYSADIKKYLQDKYTYGKSRIFPSDDSESDIGNFRKIAELLGQENIFDSLKKAPPTQEEIYNEKVLKEAKEQDRAETKAWKKIPYAARWKIGINESANEGGGATRFAHSGTPSGSDRQGAGYGGYWPDIGKQEKNEGLGYGKFWRW